MQGGRGAQDESGHLEDAAYVDEDTAETAAELHAKAAIMDCDAALEMQPGNVKAKFRKAAALHRLGRVEQARVVAMTALHGGGSVQFKSTANRGVALGEPT
jgi:Flp pilus assembly protein TadD